MYLAKWLPNMVSKHDKQTDESNVLDLKHKIPCAEIRKRTKIIDIIEYTLKQKWKWAGHKIKGLGGQDAQSGSQGEGRGREDDQAEDGKMT